MLVLIALAFIAFVALSIIGLLAAGMAHRTHTENILQKYFVLLVEKRRIVVGGLGAVVGLFVACIVISISNQPPAPCTPGLAPVSQKPSALVSAQDYLAQGDYDYERGACGAAIADYTRAIERNPKFAEAYNNRAYTYMVQHNYSAALPDLDKAIELRPDYVNALMNRGDIYNYYYEINYNRAVADYDRILQIGGREHNTSVCGHRLLAQHHGWDLGVFVEVFFTKGFDAGCN
jgi:tetratricopeptide (TPR) repeat protein